MKHLRGHHLFCATLFQGHGYDDTFTACMKQTLEELAAGESFALCSSSDDLCAACPHRQEGSGCALGTEDVFRRDQAALEATGLALGEELSVSKAGERLRQVKEDQWLSVCGGCRWGKEGLCSWELFQKLRLERFV